MALPDITQRLKLQAEGVKETETSSANIHKNLAGAAKAADALARAQSDSRRKAAAQSPRENLEYNQMRGIGQVTGAASRDFADQSRGLGGLVRLYATFAANIFAVSAAFNVLKNAADTTNLIAGLDTLGAQSGKALGTVAKRLAEVSDGAISMREAMSATAMTSSAGMTSQNILRLGMVAKNASFALGISMPDAINRLSRGITKLEPELLDELGIFTKIEPATQAYALQLGKAVTQLTDFERRQAFANAVLKEGEDKFNALADAAANPYDKLLASFKNIGQSGLELINKVLVPIVELLAKSPTALAVGIGAIIALLLKQAIPAIGQLRAGLATAATNALEIAKAKAKEAVAAREKLDELYVSQARKIADARLEAFVAAESKLQKFQEANNIKRGKFVELTKTDIENVSQADLAAARKSIAATEARIAAGKNITQTTKDRLELEKAYVKELDKLLAGEKNLEAAQQAAQGSAREKLQNNRQYLSLTEYIQQQEEKGEKRKLTANAAFNASILGVSNAWKIFTNEIETSNLKLSGTEKAFLKLRGAGAIIAGTFAGIASRLGGLLNYLGLALAGFALLEAMLSKNEKQMQAFSGAVDAAENSVENVARTLATFEDRAGFSKSIVEGAIAVSNAFNEISSSARSLIENAARAKQEMSGFDKAVDWVKTLFGKGIDQTVAKNLSSQLMSGLKLLRRSGVAAEYEAGFKQLLGVEKLTFTEVREAILNLGEDTQDRFTDLLESASKKLDKIRSDLQGFKDASDNALKAYQEFIQSTANTNPLFKLGGTIEDLGNSVVTAMRQGINGIQSMFEELDKDPRKAALFGPEFIKGFAEVRQGFMDQSNAIKTYSNLQNKLQEELEETEQKEKRLADNRAKRREEDKKGGIGPLHAGNLAEFLGVGAYGTSKAEEALQQKSKELRSQIEAIQEASIAIPTDKIEQGKQILQKGLDFVFQKGAEYIRTALGQASEKASMAIAKAWSGVLTGERAAIAQTRLAVQEIDIQIRAIDVNISLIQSQEQLAAELAALTAVQKETLAYQKGTLDEITAAEENRKAAELYLQYQRGSITAAQAIERAEKAGANALIQVRSQIQSNERKLAEQEAQKRVLGGQRQATIISGELQARRAAVQSEEQLSRATEAVNQQLIARQSILNGIAGITSQSIIKDEAALQQRALEEKQRLENKKAQLEVDLATEALAANKGKKDEKLYADQLAFNKEMADSLRKRQVEETKNLGLELQRKLLDDQLNKLQKRLELTKAAKDLEFASAEATLEINKARFTSAAQVYGFDQAYIANRQFEYDLAKANLDIAKQRTDTEANFAKQQEELDARKRALEIDDVERYQAISAEQARLNTLKDFQLSQLEQEKIKREQLLQIGKEQSLIEYQRNRQLEYSATLGESLRGIFEKLGDPLANLVEVLTKASQQLENFAKQQADIDQRKSRLDAIAMYEDTSKQQAELTKDQMDLDKQRTKAEIDNNIKSLSATKKIFGQKTAVYKTLAALEKVLHVQRMFQMAKEVGQMLISTAQFVATSLTRTTATVAEASVDGTAAVVKALNNAFPYNLVAAATVGTIVAGLLSKIGGKPAGFIPSTQQEQEVQGTAMAYNDKGEKVQVRRGVFGEPAEKSKSVSKSIENLEKYTVDGLNYDNRILNTLRSIDSNIAGAALGIYTIAGLRTGKGIEGFPQPGTASTTLGKIGSTAGMIGGAAGGFLLGGSMAAMSTLGGLGLSAGLGFGGASFLAALGGPVGLLVGAVLGKFLFSQKTETIIESSGIRLQGSIASLAENAEEGVLAFVKGVAKTKTKILGITVNSDTDAINIGQKLADIGAEGSESIITKLQNTFAMTSTLFLDIAEKAGISAEKVKTALEDSFTLDINIKDLTGPEAAEEINSAVSALLDDAANSIFSVFTDFSQFGEGLLETVVRVINTNDLIKQQLSNLGIDTGEIVGMAGMAITENLAAMSGGIENFLDVTKSFATNFYTEAERLVPVQKAVNTELNRLAKLYPELNIATVDTAQEFKMLVQSVKGLGDSGAELFTALMRIQQGFYDTYSDSSLIISLLAGLNSEILELESTSSGLDLAIAEISTKASEYVETLYQAKQATAENIAVIARWTKAATLKELRAQLKTTFEDRKRELESSISALEKIKTSLVDFKTQLLQGNLSPLSDLDKFSQLRTEYDKLLQDVRSSDSAVAEKAAEKFPALSQQLLTAASTLYGSGELYQTLHKSILADLDTTTEIVNTKLTDAQRQLELLTAQGITLGLIEANTKTTAQKFTELVTLYNAVNAVNPTTVGQTAAASIQAGNTATSSLSNAFTEQLKTIAPDIIVTPLELTPEAKAAAAAKAAAEKAAAEKAAAEKAAAEAAAKKAAEDAAKAAAEIKAAIDAQTVVLSQVLTNTSDNVVDEIKTTKYVNVGSFGKTQNLLAPMQER